MFWNAAGTKPFKMPSVSSAYQNNGLILVFLATPSCLHYEIFELALRLKFINIRSSY